MNRGSLLRGRGISIPNTNWLVEVQNYECRHRATKALMRLNICGGWSTTSLMFAYEIRRIPFDPGLVGGIQLAVLLLINYLNHMANGRVRTLH